MDNATFTLLALDFPHTESKPHFDRTAFKVIKKRTFATLHEPTNSANFKLSLKDQKALCELELSSVYPVPNKWGEKGWTTIELHNAPEEVIKTALEMSYNAIVA